MISCSCIARWAPTVNLPHTPLQLSACRRLEDGRLELRLWNPGQAAVLLPLQPGLWARVRADGQLWPDEPGQDLAAKSADALALAVHTVAPHQLITLRSHAPWSAL